MAAKNIVYFDLETQRSFGDVGGFANKAKMGVSVGVTYSTARGTYEIYTESEMKRLGEELVKADLVVGWNHMQFDYPVLQPYVFHTLAEQTLNLFDAALNKALLLACGVIFRILRQIAMFAGFRDVPFHDFPIEFRHLTGF